MISSYNFLYSFVTVVSGDVFLGGDKKWHLKWSWILSDYSPLVALDTVCLIGVVDYRWFCYFNY